MVGSLVRVPKPLQSFYTEIMARKADDYQASHSNLLNQSFHIISSNEGFLVYMINDYGRTELAVLPQTLLVEDHAVILPVNSLLREPMNRAVLQAIYSPTWKQRYINVAE
jgi:ABC-type amino acid transport substrate-binding protein